jgi:hypothetical protein
MNLCCSGAADFRAEGGNVDYFEFYGSSDL